MEKHDQELTTAPKAVKHKAEDSGNKPRIIFLNSSILLILLCSFLCACSIKGFLYQKKYGNTMNSEILSMEYYDTSKIMKKLVIERRMACENCKTKEFFVNETNNIDSTIIDYDIIIEEFEYYPNGNKKYYSIMYKNNIDKYTISWWENGLIKSKGEYHYCIESKINTDEFPWTSSINGFVKNGIWIYYSRDGKIEKTETYKNGNIQ